MNNLGKYKVIERIGSGSFGIVYKVEFEERFFAAKVPNSSEKFNNEIQTMYALDHPNIIKTRDINMKDYPSFFVMDYIEENLESCMKKNMNWKSAVNIIIDVLEGLHYVHDKDIIHGDLKPSNILFGENVMISDFGLARIVQEENQRLKNSLASRESLGGTYNYASDEQFDGVLDKRNDLYSVGVILYQLLTDNFPRSLILPSEKNPAIPKDLDNITKKALKPIDLRYQSASEFKENLKDLFPRKYVDSYPDYSAEDFSGSSVDDFPEKSVDFVNKPKKKHKKRRFLSIKPDHFYKQIKDSYVSSLDGDVKEKILSAVSSLKKVKNIYSADISSLDIFSWSPKFKIEYYPFKRDITALYLTDEFSYQGLDFDGILEEQVLEDIEACIQNEVWTSKQEENSVVFETDEEKDVWYYPIISFDIHSTLKLNLSLNQTISLGDKKEGGINETISSLWENQDRESKGSIKLLRDGTLYQENFDHKKNLELNLLSKSKSYRGVRPENYSPNFIYIGLEEALGIACVTGFFLGLGAAAYSFFSSSSKGLGLFFGRSLLGGVLGFYAGYPLSPVFWAVCNTATAIKYGFDNIAHFYKEISSMSKYKDIKKEIERLQENEDSKRDSNFIKNSLKELCFEDNSELKLKIQLEDKK